MNDHHCIRIRGLATVLTLALGASACGGETGADPFGAVPTVGSAEQAIRATPTATQAIDQATTTAPGETVNADNESPFDVEVSPVYRDEFGVCQPGSGATFDFVLLAEIVKCQGKCGGLPCGREDGQGGCELGCFCGGGIECDPYDDELGTEDLNGGDQGGGRPY